METTWSASATQWLLDQARDAGFHLAGIAPVEERTHEREARDAERFRHWVESGSAVEMEYLKRRDEEGQLVRGSVRTAMDWARSVIVCAVNYGTDGPLSLDPAARGAGWIARYARSGKTREPGEAPVAVDYHRLLLERLRAIEERVHTRFACQTRCYVDTGPLVERALAPRAGVGWIGKNTCVIDQKLGSWLLLGAIVTSMPIEAGAQVTPAPDRCGSCTRCIDACPTAALSHERTMDASRCIAYLTIEKKGAIAEDLREGMGRQIFGCDICQEVCPWNRRAPATTDAGMQARQELINPDLAAIGEMESRDFRRWFRDSPVERTGRKRLQRNAAIAMGNSGEQRFAEQLGRWSTGDDVILAEAARWALRQLSKTD